ncbi:3-keto-disaccharide hydrolase [Anaerobaca lacustris]|uniref:DUF1080 domain-containing protein n=1 Tax=Anaerobaca lacustris TaxID=3044600 RepID=A0AAW6TRY2_9BACT|nr:DUF1080 domain-containing protein [Sedimentisphaerales bacterium M17dextr]
MQRTVGRIALWTIVAMMVVGLVGCKGALESGSTGKKVMLWNGQDFAGWQRVLADPAVDVDDVWWVRGDAIHCKGEPFGYLRTEQRYSDYHLHLEWRWPETPTNSGVLLHMNGPDKIWPECIEVQLKAGNAGDFVLMNGTGLTVDGTDRRDTSKRFVVIPKKAATSEKPAGQWNSYDIHCKGGSIRVYVNGVLQNEGTNASPMAGFIGLQSEGSPIEFRNIYILPLN